MSAPCSVEWCIALSRTGRNGAACVVHHAYPSLRPARRLDLHATEKFRDPAHEAVLRALARPPLEDLPAVPYKSPWDRPDWRSGPQ